MTVDDSSRLKGGKGARVQSFAFVISICVCSLLCAGLVPGIVAEGPACDVELEGRINPNDAPVASLVRLSGIGVSRAAAIVAYRDAYKQDGGAGEAFRDCSGLQKVKGIGPKTVENNRRWLKFE